MAVRLSSNGTLSADVASDAELLAALELFKSQVMESVLTDGRVYDVRLNYYAGEPREDGLSPELF